MDTQVDTPKPFFRRTLVNAVDTVIAMLGKRFPVATLIVTLAEDGGLIILRRFPGTMSEGECRAVDEHIRQRLVNACPVGEIHREQ